MVLVIQHKVELIEVSMNQAVIGQFDYELHELIVQGWWILQLMHLAPERQTIHTKYIRKCAFTITIKQERRMACLHTVDIH